MTRKRTQLDLLGEGVDVSEVVEAEIVDESSSLVPFDYKGFEVEQTTLETHAHEIRKAVRQSVQAIVEAGLRLNEVKEILGHGRFLAWVETCCDLDQRMARHYMKVADQFKSENFSDLKIAPSALYKLAADSTPDSVREAAIERAKQGQRVTHSLVLKLMEEAPSKPRKARHENDAYDTDPRLTAALLARVEITGRVFECCAGKGDIVRVVEQVPGCLVEAGDLEPRFEGCEKFDATSLDQWQARDAYQRDKIWSQDWTVTNPPFTDAIDILDLAYRHSRLGVAFLLRLSFLEPCKDRANWLSSWSNSLRFIIPFSPRPSFRDDTSGADQVTVAWFVWDKAFSWRDRGIECPFQFVPNWR